MANTFLLEIVTPKKMFFSGNIEALTINAPDGEMGILKDHMPMVAVVDIGPVKILRNGMWLEATVTEGFLEIMPDKTVIICDAAEWPNEIDVDRALAAEERAKERLRRQLSDQQYVRAKAALQRAVSRIKASEHKNKSL